MRDQLSPVRIECLACGAVRPVRGVENVDTGECPRCRYVGWTYADDLDARTQRLILNGVLAVPPAERLRRGKRPGRRRFV